MEEEPEKKPFLSRINKPAKRRRSTMVTEERGLIQNLRAYPPSVFLMLGNEFCERFSFYGMKAILTLYFIIEHHYTPSSATFVYHAFTSLAFLSPLLGSLLADSYFGKFKVILYGSIIYVLGHIFISLGAIPSLEYTTRTFLDFSGLFIIALATGGIKPCVSAFAADQFPKHQEHLRSQFFSFFYFAINGGSLFAIMLTPILRGRVSCLGSEYCFPLAFGVPGMLMVMALILFICGTKMYKVQPPSKENIVFEVVGCIFTGASRTLFGTSASANKPVSHWLERAAPNYPSHVIKSVRSFCKVAMIFGPLVFFWALFDQQGSTWVLQARRLNGRIGWLTILPEQINTLNPLIVLIMVPVFEAWVYPALRKVVHVTPLRKMAVGGLLTAVAFMMAGVLQLKVNGTLEETPMDENVFVQNIGNSSHVGRFTLLGGNEMNLLPGRNEVPAGDYAIDLNGNTFTLNLSHPGMGYVAGAYEYNNLTQISLFKYNLEKTDNGASRIYVVVPSPEGMGNLYVVNWKGEVTKTCPLSSGEHVDILPPLVGEPRYKLYFGANCSGTDCPQSVDFEVQMGSAHVLHIHNGASSSDLHELVRPNTVSILWVIPQYIVITLGEIHVSVTGLEFAYSQSAPNMKSVLQALWLLTVFMGNVFDMLISGSHLISEPAVEFFFYAFLMVLVMIIFILLAMRYTYVEDDDSLAEIDEEEPPLEHKDRIPTEDTNC